MQDLKIISSQTIRFTNPASALNVFLPDIVASIKEHFRFVGAPEKVEDYNVDEGMLFRYGVFPNVIISTLRVYRAGFLMEGASDSSALDEALDSLEILLATQYGLTVQPAGPVSRVYTSHLEFTLGDDATRALNVLDAFRGKLREAAKRRGIDAGEYIVGSFALVSDPAKSSTAVKPSRFILERRNGFSHDQNRFFSEAPLPTKEHVQALGDLEMELIEAAK